MTEEAVGPRLVQFPKGAPLTDVVAHLRGLADAIEQGRHGEVDRVTLVLATNGSVPVAIFGFGGNADVMSMLGLLNLGQQRLGQMMLVGSVARGS